MNIILLSTFLFIMTVVSADVNPQKDVQVKFGENQTTISWAPPSDDVHYLKIIVANRTTELRGENLTVPFQTNLQKCQQYQVVLRYEYRNKEKSSEVNKTFWSTDNIYYANIGKEKEILFNTTNMTEGHEYNVSSPSNTSVDFSINQGQLNISFPNLNQADGGLYKVVNENLNTEDCFLLVVTDLNATILEPSNGIFEGDRIKCKHDLKVWPAEMSADVVNNLVIDGKHVNPTESLVEWRNIPKNITCRSTIENTNVSDTSRVLLLDPFYGSENAGINTTDSVNVTEGQNLLPIGCFAECYPNCTYVWRFKGDTVTEDQMLRIENISRKQSGKYKCKIKHEHDKKRSTTKVVRINVQYPPSFEPNFNFTSNNSETTQPTSNYTWNEQEKDTIDFTLVGNPAPEVSLLSNKLNKIISSYPESDNRFTFPMPNLTCEDTGKYTIQAQNGIPPTANKTVFFTIYCRPKHIVLQRKEIVTDYGTTEIINGTLISFPKPNVTWTNLTDTPWKIKEEDGFQFIFTSSIKLQEKSNFGVLGIQFCNIIGCAYESIKMSKRRSLTGEDISYFLMPVIMTLLICFLLSVLVLYSRWNKQKNQQMLKLEKLESKEQVIDEKNERTERIPRDQGSNTSGDDERKENVSSEPIVSFQTENELPSVSKAQGEEEDTQNKEICSTSLKLQDDLETPSLESDIEKPEPQNKECSSNMFEPENTSSNVFNDKDLTEIEKDYCSGYEPRNNREGSKDMFKPENECANGLEPDLKQRPSIKDEIKKCKPAIEGEDASDMSNPENEVTTCIELKQEKRSTVKEEIENQRYSSSESCSKDDGYIEMFENDNQRFSNFEPQNEETDPTDEHKIEKEWFISPEPLSGEGLPCSIQDRHESSASSEPQDEDDTEDWPSVPVFSHSNDNEESTVTTNISDF